ncbi:MAG: nucleotide sugar dehydrogenase [Melioribacteraceae bacterium]|nr:nucleotide sugar dehydrogenase [Melioribacteraceae bacterium]MCF8356080.1 nucleotide sugar dehydrogenase [Melioribacteraceae bacterium]MCF8395535.1 nucleotide sugar dehydrogenase [Melioribacteraceae bacterium]MCF8420607.1 nucleotide sugar dehydrogenase [Melioribacteraceae bacterium]
MKNELLKKINEKSAVIGIVGLGYVGLPLGLEYTENGFNVLGFDLDEKKVNDLEQGKTYIKHIPTERIKRSVDAGLLKATTDFTRMPEVDAIIICVPTPLDEHREPDMSYVVGTAETIQKYLRKGQIVTLESTTYPGTTDEILLPLFESAPSKQNADDAGSKFTVGKDFFLAFSPEREDPNNPSYTTKTIPKVVGGITADCLEVAVALYDKVIIKTVPVSSTRAAEATKLLENIYRSINIALVNELKMVFHKMDIDIWEVIDAASTKPFGYNAFYPGPGLGGHCIPIDPFYLTWKAREYEMNTKFIELAGEINTFQPHYVVQRAMEVLNDESKSLKGSKVLILGAAYKKNVDDMRESPSLKLIEIFREKGAAVDYNDPYVPALPKTRKYQYNMNSVDITDSNLSNYDLVVLSTDHDDYNYEFIKNNSKLILDTRNAFKKNGLVNGNIHKA